MNTIQFIKTLNHWGQNNVPFLFMVDFEMENPIAIPLADVDPLVIQYNFQGFTNESLRHNNLEISLRKNPITFDAYKERFDKVMSHLKQGDSFLTNLTIRTELRTDLTLNAIYSISKAKYKLHYKDNFVFFSPEPFIQISDNKISSFPMKGTIDAIIPNAKDTILKDQKELSEHITIVDLIRNDLSQVAENVEVVNFRYVEEVTTHDKTLLQVSSQVTGYLSNDYRNNIGDIIIKLLPAGSVSGAPKVKTLEIISAAEGSKRGYYTGVCGYFDGTTLDSGVMIRFIENNRGTLYYRSGGGITAQSNDREEYLEAINKIYVPID